jgi:hypothetical protein
VTNYDGYRPPTAHSGPYPTGDPQKPEDVIDTEAALVFLRWKRGESIDDIAPSLGLSRSVAYERLKLLISGRSTPNRLMLRAQAIERLQDQYLKLQQTLEQRADMTTSDLVKVVDLQRKVVDTGAALTGIKVPVTESDDGDLSDPEDWGPHPVPDDQGK